MHHRYKQHLYTLYADEVNMIPNCTKYKDVIDANNALNPSNHYNIWCCL